MQVLPSILPDTPSDKTDRGSPSVWINSDEFGELAGIKRAARDALLTCLNGGTWRSTQLQVREIQGNGGRGGKSYQVYVPSLPENLRAIWYSRNNEALNPPKPQPVMLPMPETISPNIAAEVSEWQWKLSVIGPALRFPKRSRGRGEMLTDISSKTHIRPDGKAVTMCPATLRSWIDTLEKTMDETALVRKRPAKNVRRVIITRAWDKAAPFPETEKKRIAAEIETYTRSLWKEGVPGWEKVNALASSKLLEISQTAGWLDATQTECTLGRHYCERYRSASIVATKEKDAKRWTDHYEPTIRRDRPKLPMDIVIGDVHPLDILITTADGREITPRLIAWLDWATGDIHTTLVFLGKNQGIRQDHIASSFVAMVKDWGLPRRLYLDNGSEYKWDEMMEAFKTLTGLAGAFDIFLKSAREIDAATGMDDAEPQQEAAKAVTRAKPYNARAKAIEAVFGILERYFLAMIPGWIGGNRMNKRTHRVGKKPKPFPGSEQDFEQAFNQAIAFYRSTEQGGTMGGKSPNERKREGYENPEFQPFTAPHEAFLLAFATIERPKVQPGGIQVSGQWYYHDCLIPHIGYRLEIHAAKWDKDFVTWLDENGHPHLIPQAKLYSPDDRAGAIEQSRRKGLALAHVKEKKAGTSKLDLLQEITRHNAMQPPPPALPHAIEIGINPQVKSLAEIRKNPPKLREITLHPGSFRHKQTGQVVEMATPAEPDQPGQTLDLDKHLIESAKKR